MSEAGANTYGLDVAAFAFDIDSETDAYMSAQRTMFSAEMRAQNRMQAQTTLHEFDMKMNDAAWKTTSSSASDKIQ